MDSTGHRKRLRERFIKGEKSALSDESLLELILVYAIPQKDVLPLAKNLLKKYGNLDAVLQLSVDDLCSNDGLKENTAVLIKLIDAIKNGNKPKEHSSKKNKDGDEQKTLFGHDNELTGADGAVNDEEKKRRKSGLFSKAVLKETIEILPTIPVVDSVDEIRKYLRSSLHFNSEQTRLRYSNYIIQRMFPSGSVDTSLINYAKTFRNKKELAEVCFYKFMKAEPVVEQVIHGVLFPNLSQGVITRQQVRKYLEIKYPEAKSYSDYSKGIIEALIAGGIVKATRDKLSFGFRDIPLYAFAYIIHSEFSDVGMHSISKIHENRSIQAMLWREKEISTSLYELRNKGIISKVSEIDNIRQFTLKWDVVGFVEYISKDGQLK